MWGVIVICICRRDETIPIAAVAIAIRYDYWFSKIMEAQTPV